MTEMPASAVTAYTGQRDDVTELIIGRPRRILDIGCSDGTLLAGLGDQIETTGVEFDPELAAVARGRVGTLIEADALVAAERLRESGQQFDLVICADILEHLIRPDLVLNEVVAMLAPGGQLIVSLPNVRFWTTFWELGVRGRWPRRTRGVHDETHLRWFTHRDAVAMFSDAGLEVDLWKRNYRLSDDPTRRGNSLARLFAWGVFRPFVTYQNRYRLSPADRSVVSGRTS